MSIGYQLKMQREGAKLTQGELARQTGITQAARYSTRLELLVSIRLRWACTRRISLLRFRASCLRTASTRTARCATRLE